jgi:predicted Zn-dependent peptidase
MASKPYFLFNFPNGFRLVFWPLSGIRVVCSELWIKAGSWYGEPKRGIFHFLEHVLAQGSRKYPSFKKLSQKQEELGLSISDAVGGEASYFSWLFPRENFSPVLDLLGEYIFYPLISSEDIEKERKIIFQEYQDKWDSPYNRFWYTFSLKFWGENHPYTFDGLGTKEGIASINKNDLLMVHKKWYQPQNMTMAIVGDLKATQVEKKIKEIFGKKNGTSFLPKLNLPPCDFKKKIFYYPENFEQMTLGISFPSFGYHDKERRWQIGLSLLHYILVSGRWSRLVIRLREKESLVYSLWGALRFFPQKGFFDIYVSASPQNISRIFALIKREIEEIKRGVKKEEFQRAQKYFLYHSSMSFDSVYNIANNLITYLFREGKVFLPEDGQREIKKVRQEDLQILAQEILDFSKVTVGVMGKKENFINLDI